MNIENLLLPYTIYDLKIAFGDSIISERNLYDVKYFKYLKDRWVAKAVNSTIKGVFTLEFDDFKPVLNDMSDLVKDINFGKSKINVGMVIFTQQLCRFYREDNQTELSDEEILARHDINIYGDFITATNLDENLYYRFVFCKKKKCVEILEGSGGTRALDWDLNQLLYKYQMDIHDLIGEGKAINYQKIL